MFGEHTYPIRFFQPALTLRNNPNSWTRLNKKVFFAKRNFSFFALFCPFLNSTQSEFGGYENEFKHCTPSIVVSLAFPILTVPILIRLWRQNTTKEKRDLHIPKYPYFYPSLFALFLHFFSITCCKQILQPPPQRLGNIFQHKTKVARQNPNAWVRKFTDYSSFFTLLA